MKFLLLLRCNDMKPASGGGFRPAHARRCLVFLTGSAATKKKNLSARSIPMGCFVSLGWEGE